MFQNNADILGDNPDSSEAIEFLCLAESAEVTHYEVLNAMSKKVNNEKLSTRLNIILREEKRIYYYVQD